MSKRGVFGTLDSFLETGPILGRKVANTGMLRHLLAADPFSAYHFFLADQTVRADLNAALAALAPEIHKDGRILVLDRRELPGRLATTDYACFHQSDCIVHPPHLARLRNAYSRALFPITGPIHSLSYPNYPAAFLHHLWAGATPRDCIIATSRAGRAAVEQFFDHLRQGFGLASTPGPSLRIVPLGVDPELAETPVPGSEARRGELRKELGLPPERALILVLGRISHASKMDVLPLIRALSRLFSGHEGAAKVAPQSVALVLAGWTDDDDSFPQTLVDIGARLGLTVLLEKRPGERRKAKLLAACDIFASIADNPQETFGLTILEAQAAGLPVVASDYSGYRDLLEHGAAGLLVPTLGPAADASASPQFFPDDGLADQLAPVLFDNQYHLIQAQRVSVDTPLLAQALGALLADPALRRRMGAAGRKRVRREFLWPQIIRRHLELWDELRTLPAPDIETLRHVPHPLHLPYARIFAPYPTHALAPQTRLEPGRAGLALLAGREHPLLYAGLDCVIRPHTLRSLVFLARKGILAGELVARWLESNRQDEHDSASTPLDMEAAAAHILWAVKHDLLQHDLPRHAAPTSGEPTSGEPASGEPGT